jgi:hypothetical protein
MSNPLHYPKIVGLAAAADAIWLLRRSAKPLLVMEDGNIGKWR